MKRLLVTGSRDWPDENKVALELGRALGELSREGEDVVVVHGGAKGVDSLAERLAKQYGFPTEVHRPEWAPYGIYNPQAGKVRNTKMVELGADLCLAFMHNNSAGTKDCMMKAYEAGIDVRSYMSFGSSL